MSTSSDLPRFSWSEVCARRLERHGLSAPLQDPQPAGAARAMCGAHAQILTAGEYSIGLRLQGINQAEIREALWSEHSLIKTYGPRGTIHLLPAADLPIWCGALSVIQHSQSGYPEEMRLSVEQIDAIVEATAAILLETELTAGELTDALVDRVGPWAGEMMAGGFLQMWPRWRLALVAAANRGALCFAPNKGRNVTYTNPRRWLPGFAPADSESSLARIVLWFLQAYGPATHHHFARWFATPPGWAADLFASISNQLEPVILDGAPAWTSRGDTQAPVNAPTGVWLLPYFDAYAIGCHPRELVFPGRAAERALSGGQAGNFPVLLLDGVVGGIWQQRRSGKKIEITVEPFETLTAGQQSAIDHQAARIGEFFDGKPQWAVGTVTTGGHA